MVNLNDSNDNINTSMHNEIMIGQEIIDCETDTLMVIPA